MTTSELRSKARDIVADAMDGKEIGQSRVELAFQVLALPAPEEVEPTPVPASKLDLDI